MIRLPRIGHRPPQEKVLPAIDAEHCVLGHVVPIACDRCSVVCPEAAIVQDDTMLGVDADACTACGLCQAACPQSAVDVVEPLPVRGERALAVCEASDEKSRPTIACIHAIDHAMLATLHEAGVRTIEQQSGDCSACRNGGRVDFADTLASFNRLLDSRTLPLITSEVHVSKWLPRRFHRPRENAEAPSNKSRRRLLFAQAIEAFGSEDAASPVEYDPGRRRALQTLLAKSAPEGQGDPLQAHLPSIDVGTCTACDLCTRVCPTGALTLQRGAGSGGSRVGYRIQPERCTDCKACEAICESDAISVKPMQAGRMHRLPLNESRCSACGVTFHSLRAIGSSPQCSICNRTNHGARLFQVLE